MKIFQKYSDFYDLIYFDKDYTGEINYIINKFNRFKLPSKNILEYGSGTGKHGILLAEKGYNIIGVEASKKMFNAAINRIKESGIEERFRLNFSDISEFRAKGKFGAVVSLFHVISYLTENVKLLKVFKNASNHLIKHGLFIFDVWYAAAVLSLQPQDKVKEINTDEWNIFRFTHPTLHSDKNVVDVNFKIVALNKINGQSDFIEETHKMRYFSIPEIDFLARTNSFDLIHTEEFMTGNNPSETTWGVCFVLRKK